MGLEYDDFGEMANDAKLSSQEKIGFDNKREESLIFPDINNKLRLGEASYILDIGCGCSKPVIDLINFCTEKNKTLVLVDHPNMLQNIKKYINTDKNIFLVGGKFPEIKNKINQISKKFDAVICYSVLHHIIDMNYFKFIDEAVLMLKEGGRFLIADIPNESKKRRFLSTEWGKNLHRKWSKGKEPPKHALDELPHLFDDSIVFQILYRYRRSGLETYLLRQNDGLPYCYTREDIVIERYK